MPYLDYATVFRKFQEYQMEKKSRIERIRGVPCVVQNYTFLFRRKFQDFMQLFVLNIKGQLLMSEK